MINRILSFLFIIYFSLFPFGQLDRIETSIFTVHITDIIVCFIAGLFLLKSTSKKYLESKYSFYILSFIYVAVLSFLVNISLVSQHELLRGFLYLVRLVSYLIFFFALLNIVKDKKILNKFLSLSGSLITIFAIVQYILMPDTTALFHFGWDNHYFRSIGTFLDPAFLGIILVLFILYQLNINQETKYKKLILLVSVIALSVTFSRSSYLALFFGLMASNFKYLNIRKTLVIICVFFIAILMSPKPSGEGVNLSRTSTINYRLINYEYSLEKGIEKPLFGYGYNLINMENNLSESSKNHSSYGVDSSILFIFLTTGIVGLIIFLSFIYHILISSWRDASKNSILVYSSFVAVIVHSLFQNSFFYPWVLGWLVVLLAMNEIKGKEILKTE